MVVRTKRAGVAAMTAGLIVALAGASAAYGQGPANGVKDDPAHRAIITEGLRGVIASARDRVFPALVNISVITVSYGGGKEIKGGGTGSGTIFSKEGHVLTNAHVTSKGRKFKVTLADKQTVSATLVGEDAATDLAVLKINLSELTNAGSLPVAEFGNSDEIEVGDYVLAMGSPFSLSRSVTLGIVSNNERVFAGGFGNDEVEAIDYIDGRATGMLTRWLQHDALINPGNSGGPLVSLQGKVVGVNTRGGAGMGFASPINLAADIAGRLIAHGEVPRSTIGWALRQIEKTGEKEGVLITSVTQNPPGPAAKAGIEAGDLLLSIDGQAVTVRFSEQIPPLLRALSDRAIGSKVEVTYRRKGEVRSATITTEKLLDSKGDETLLRMWGLSCEEITEQMARDLRLESRDGVYVTGVKGGSPPALAEPPIGGGDILRGIGGQPVRTIAEVVERYKTIMAEPEKAPEFLLVEFDRQGKRQVTLIKPRPVKPEDPPREAAKAWVGVATQIVLKDLARELGHEGQTGFRITRVYPRTLAAESGLKAGDVITAIDGEKLSPRGTQDGGLLKRRIERMKIDEKARFAVIREGKETEVEVTLERTRIGPDEARKDNNKDFELSVRELTFFDRDELRWDESVKGVLVSGVERAGWAGLGGLFDGDLIQKIDDAVVTDLASYRAAMADVAKRQPERVTFVVLRGSRTHYKFVEPDWKPVVEKHGKD
ncbi:MAG: PDZ domain-containing protein [Phycisphaerae bacterium]|nr:PDZ domain-containing protein [Phycisphaerae bacterium]